MDAGISSERYARQTILPEVGAAGQARLARARVLVIGAGALGTPALYYLAAAGVGTLGIADDDRLELSNLHRQILYRTEDIGRLKAQAAAERLAAFNPDIHIETDPVRVTADNAVELIARYDLTIDATDRLETKFLINDACAKAERPLVHAAILGFEARVAVFDARTGPCLRCLFPTPPETPALSCAEAGVLGAVTGMAGSLQALETIKCILASNNQSRDALSSARAVDNESPLPSRERDRVRGTVPCAASRRNPSSQPSPARGEGAGSLRTLLGRLWLLDGRSLETRVVELPRDPACPVCLHPPESIRLAPAPVAVARILPEELAAHPEALLVDVREDGEWADGHLDGAIHRPLSRLPETTPPVLPERGAYIVYCAHGIRSETAARILTEAGYRNVYSLSGGLAAVPTEPGRRQ